MTQMLYMMILAVALWLGWIAEKKNKKVYLYVVIVILTIVAGFRGENCGVDTPAYYENIIRAFPYPWKFREEGFRLIANLVMDKFGNPQIVFVLCAFVTNALILMRLWDFKDEASFGFMNLLYILLYYSNSMNIMRQYMAVALVFYGTRYLKKKKVFFMLFIIMSLSIHRASLLAIGYLGIALWRGFTKRQKMIFGMPMFLIFGTSLVYLKEYWKSDISAYLEQVVGNVNITYFYLFFCTLIVWLIYKLNVGVKMRPYLSPIKESNVKIDSSVVLYVLIGLAFNALSMFFAFVGRTGLYYAIYDIVFWGIACKEFKNARLNKVLIMIYAVYVFALVIIRNDIELFPYEFFLY